MPNLGALDIVDSDCVGIVRIPGLSLNHDLFSHCRDAVVISDAYDLPIDCADTDPSISFISILTEIENLVLFISINPRVSSIQGLARSRLRCGAGLAGRDACLLGLRC